MHLYTYSWEGFKRKSDKLSSLWIEMLDSYQNRNASQWKIHRFKNSQSHIKVKDSTLRLELDLLDLDDIWVLKSSEYEVCKIHSMATIRTLSWILSC